MDSGYQIRLDGAHNTRDLGGYRTLDGRRVRERRLVRSGELYNTTKEDQKILFETYGIKKIIDFRTDLECKKKPDPVYPGVERIENPILSAEVLGISTGQVKEGDNPTDMFLGHAASLNGDAIAYIRPLYANLVTNEFAIAHYRRFFEILLEHDGGAVLWHCSAGKDRVGVGTALLLLALGAGRELVITDYVKSNEYLKDEIKALGQYAFEKTKDQVIAQTAMLLDGVAREYLEAAFAKIQEDFGSVENYLETAMGLTPERITLLRDKYLE